MSWYTNKLHDDIRRETTFWDSHAPQNEKEYFQYAEYQYGLADYRMALPWYEKAAAEGNGLALYRLGEASWHGYGREKNEKEARQYFRLFMTKDGFCDGDAELALFFQGNCFAFGWGVEKDPQKAEACFLKMGETSGLAMEALGVLYKDNHTAAGHADKAKTYFRRALELGSLQAPFYLYELSGFDLVHFAYKQELFEHFSFIAGRLVRAAELRPCKEYYDRLGHFYETAVPNDYQWNMDKFRKFAEKYYALGEKC